jgi:hypothetical protein
MILGITVGILALLIAMNGLLYQPKKDASAPATWSNINTVGKLLFLLIILINVLNIVKSIYDSYTREIEITKRNSEITQLMDSQQALIGKQEELKDINGHLIKVMSVADGYNAIIRGVVTFRRRVSDSQIRDALNNLFLKYAEVKISAVNRLGRYEGKIDYASHPEVRKFLNLSDGQAHDQGRSIFNKYRDILSRHSHDTPIDIGYYFELRCTHIKILNGDKIQYARFQPNEILEVTAERFLWSSDFGRLYNVSSVFIDEIEIQELGTVTIRDVLHFY